MRRITVALSMIMLIAVMTACGADRNAPVSENPLVPAVTATPTGSPAPTDVLVPMLTVTPTLIPSPTEVPAATEAPTLTATPTPLPERTNGEVYFNKINHFITAETLIEIKTDVKKEAYITYTIDGTEPQRDSTLYEGPICFAAGMDTAPNCYTIKAKAWYEDGTESGCYVQTYFVAEQTTERFSTYILSVNGEPGELTEGPDGILYQENAKKRGREYERKVHLELIAPDGETVFMQYAGLRAYGGDSRKHAIKPFKIYARKEYQNGKGMFAFDGFGTPTTDGSGIVEKYDKLVLRNGGDDFQQSGLREELVHRLARDAGFAAYEAVVPVAVYMNGTYYGFLWMHESYCDKYFQYRNGKSDGEYVVLEGNDKQKYSGNSDLEAAAATEYNKIYNTYSVADLTVDETYEALNALIDVENYLDYMSYNIYIGNNDWPYNNYRCFRYYAEDGVYGEGERDGRWRYLLHDADVAFSCYYSNSETAFAERENLRTVIEAEGDLCYSPLLAALLKREECRQYFLDCMDYYMEEAVSYDRVKMVLDELMAECEKEIPYHYQYLDELRKTEDSIWMSLANREKSIATILRFAELRPKYMKQQLSELLRY